MGVSQSKQTKAIVRVGDPPAEGFPPVFESNPDTNTVMVIPGDEELFVGGGALNGATGVMLRREAKHPISYRMEGEKEVYDKNGCPYAKLHKEQYAKARSRINTLHHASREQIDDLALPLRSCSARSFSESEHPFGAVFLDIFKKESRPFSLKNMGIAYTIGALGQNAKAPGEGEVPPEREALVYKEAGAFLGCLFKTGVNIATVAVDYNQKNAANTDDFPRLQTLRVPIVSGGIFIHPKVTKVDAGLSLILGFNSVLKDHPKHAPALQLMPSPEMTEVLRKFEANEAPGDLDAKLLPKATRRSSFCPCCADA